MTTEQLAIKARLTSRSSEHCQWTRDGFCSKRDEDCSLSHTKGSHSLDLGRHSKMFRPSCTSSSPFSFTDLDMWDTKSRFAAQTSAWCGMAAVSGTGFLSKVSTSKSGSTGGFRQNDPSLRKWQSLSHLAPEGPTRSFSPSPGAELRAARGASSFRQAEVGQWLHDAHEHLDTQLDRLMSRTSQLSYNISAAQLLDMKQKLHTASYLDSQQLSEATLEQEKEAAELSQFEKSWQRGELHEKVLQLEKDLMQMRSTLARGSNDQPPERSLSSLSKPMSQEDLNRQDSVDTELCKLRDALRDAEARAKTQEEERNQALQELQTSTQRALLSQIEEMNQRFSHARQNHSEVQEQLHEANNKISQACLEKAILSTQVLKLEDDIKELKTKLTRRLSDKDHLIQEKGGLHQRAQVLEVQMKREEQGSEGCDVIQTDTESHNNKQDQETVLMEQSKALREVNEKLICELEMIKQKLNTSQSQLQQITAERVINSKQITDLEAECSQLMREKEELRKMNEGQHEELTEIKEQCCQLRKSVEVLELEKLNLQDRCLRLEVEVLEKEEKLHLQEEEYRKQEEMRVQSTEELKAVARHWTEKWQKVALTLQSTQAELEELKKNNSRNELKAEDVHLAETEKLMNECQKDKEENELLQHKADMETLLTRAKRESDSLLKVELEACKQELELERSKSQAMFHRYKDRGDTASVQTQDKETVTDLSQSSLLWELLSDSLSSQNKPVQTCMQSSEVQRLMQILAEREKELREKEEALKSLERLREIEINEARLKISAPELKTSENCQDDGGQASVTTTDSLRAQLEESRRRANQLQQEKTLAVQKLQTLRQLYPINEKPDEKGWKDKNVCPVNLEAEQQRRMVTEQLKSLFKEREGKEVGKVDSKSASSPLQDWTPTSKVMRSAGNRRCWQQDSGLMPVFEEDEETSDCPGGEEGKPAEEAQPEENVHISQQMSTMRAEISSLKAKNENLLQATLRCKQPIQDRPNKSSDTEVPSLSHCSDEIDLQQRRGPSIYPDGIFLAKLVDICSPDEDEEDN